MLDKTALINRKLTALKQEATRLFSENKETYIQFLINNKTQIIFQPLLRFEELTNTILQKAANIILNLMKNSILKIRVSLIVKGQSVIKFYIVNTY